MSANQLRLWFSTFAYLLLIDLREERLKGSAADAKASPGIIRTQPAQNRGGGDGERLRAAPA